MTAATAIRRNLDQRDFETLFIEELGWDIPTARTVEIAISDDNFVLEPVAQKRNFVVFHCPAAPDHATRQKVEREVSKSAVEHLIVFADPDSRTQHWQHTERRPGRPPKLLVYQYPERSDEDLVQRLRSITFDIDEEDDLTVLSVKDRVKSAFHAERVTKKFYAEFKKERASLIAQIEGVDDPGDESWYASLLMNRLMFIYFMQKKAFLDGDLDYLRNRLERVQALEGPDHFYSFYRDFLLPLFHHGLGARGNLHSDTVIAELIGDVPYINGGIFDLHELERVYEINVPDGAFHRIFKFFDSYRWHLDDRPLKSDKEINPDVLGYIFEQYVNQKETGAYYTKEDVTGYMSATAIAPVVLDRIASSAAEVGASFDPWSLLVENPDRYVPESMLHGLGKQLPSDIAEGVEDVDKRAKWHQQADEDIGLPSENWYTAVERRLRAQAAIRDAEAGRLKDTTAATTGNLDLRLLATDAIRTIDDPVLLLAAWDSIRTLTVLDPTCGSGAFLFAALEVLTDLYDAAIDAMLGMTADAPEEKPNQATGRLSAVVARFGGHDRAFAVRKTIALNNLYGVDIMAEAVEIAKLRLFLRIIATVEDRGNVRPLPDLDLNIRSGNSVVGYVSQESVEELAGEGSILTSADARAAVDRAKEAAEEFDRFRALQEVDDAESDGVREAKDRILELEDDLRETLDRLKASERAVTGEDDYLAWRARHEPFHWFAEFHAVMARGGFDVVLGNPPYIAMTKVTPQYQPDDFATSSCPDLYALVLERSAALTHPEGRMAMIVMLSLARNDNTQPLREVLRDNFPALWVSSFGRIPDALFSAEARVRNTIVVGGASAGSVLYSTRIHRWSRRFRPHLFETLRYGELPAALTVDSWPRFGSEELAGAFVGPVCELGRWGDHLVKTKKEREKAAGLFSDELPTLGYKTNGYNWVPIFREPPPTYGPDGAPAETSAMSSLTFDDERNRDAAFLVAAGKLMYVWWTIHGDDFNVTQDMFASFPIDLPGLRNFLGNRLDSLVDDLEAVMQENLVFKNNKMRVGNYHLGRCRHVTDVSDRLIAEFLRLDHVWDEIEFAYHQSVQPDRGEAE